MVMYSYTYEHYDSCRERDSERKRESDVLTLSLYKWPKTENAFSAISVYQYEDIRDNIQVLINFSNYISFPLIAKLISKRDSLQDINYLQYNFPCAL